MLKRFAPLACLLFGVALVAPVGVAPVAPASAGTFEDEAKRFVGNAFKAASGMKKGTGKGRAESVARFTSFIERRIATKALARFVLGPYWKRASEAERAEFHLLFRVYLTRSFGQQAARLAGRPVEIDKVVRAAGSNDVLVLSRLGVRGPSALHIDWRIRRTEDGPKLIDVIVQGTSLAVAQRQQFMSMLSRNGGSIAALNAEMKKRFKAEPDGLPSVARQPAGAKQK